ncbi:glycoside hydrolase family 3 N-terminal domain-containing protein [Rhodothermus marinus]|uniref:glycoside hydrolase family 3 N-terminal domain-containing protein n=1 Tax=Rhodothermus marinus TaxID=29549 RepID=UPI001374F280|nr:glycoside hydrolase family 3 N-terminal domain-containing protein [Rhodothermus marinus]
MRQVLVFLGVMLLLHLKAAAQERPAYLDPTLPIEVRVEDLLGRMTLEEKVAQMLSMWQTKRLIVDEQNRFDPSRAPEWFKLGIGRIERPSEYFQTAREAAAFTNAIQRWVKENTRLGIPVLFHEEALHGIQAAEATSYPQAIALASTWNPALVERVYGRIAREVRARGVHQVLAPVVDVGREPRWGRIEETFGEDPYLVAEMGKAAVWGLQGRRVPPVGPGHVIATLKHMAGHGQPESGINVAPVFFGERHLREVFLYPFREAVEKAHALSVMASYNEIDGIPSHVNAWMLRDVLRGEWGFRGVIVSDWFAIRQLITKHHVAADEAEAARRALAATVDIELPDYDVYPVLLEQVKKGLIPESAVDEAVRRLLWAKFAVGLFDGEPYVDEAEASRVNASEEDRALALEAAREAIILLKNDGLLPLEAGRLDRVAVIGPHAGEVLLGGYSGRPRYTVSILEGLRERLRGEAEVLYAEGVRITEDSVFTDEPQPHLGGERAYPRWVADTVVWTDPESNRRRIEEAVALARRSDVAILVVGGNEQTSREAWAVNHLGDRLSLRLPGQQEELVKAVSATGVPVVLVVIGGQPYVITELVDRVGAIVWGWYLGQETGRAVAEVLLGDYNPAGRLPITIPRHEGQLPAYYSHKPSKELDYVDGTSRPLFPFGYGLSYTRFAYRSVRLEPDRVGGCGVVRVLVELENVGDRAGDEVVQVYVRDRVSSVARPVKELKGFRRVHLGPGERKVVEIELGPEAFAFYGLEMERVVEAGWFDVLVGGNSEELISVPLEITEDCNLGP